MATRHFTEADVVYQAHSANHRFMDLRNRKFGRLRVLGYAGSVRGRGKWWCRCGCSCGKIIKIATHELIGRRTRSCGCWQREATARANSRHGGSKTPEYCSWASMVNRCHNPRARRFSDYGGRGITVCQRWLHSFASFFADMGPRPSPTHSIDRFPDTNGPYSPDNCRWATQAEQAANTRKTVRVMFQGESMCASEAARRIGVNAGFLVERFKLGETIEAIAARIECRKAFAARRPYAQRSMREKTYGCWKGMVSRCHDSTNKSFARYGMRGVLVCPRWRNSFENFLDDVGIRPSTEHSLDRYPNQQGSYEPGNVRWATKGEQNQNRRSAHLISFDGATHSITEWAEIVGIPAKTIGARLREEGWSVERALTEPVRQQSSSAHCEFSRGVNRIDSPVACAPEAPATVVTTLNRVPAT